MPPPPPDPAQRTPLVAQPSQRQVVAVPPSARRRRIGELLLDDGLLTEGQLEEALRSTATRGARRERLGQTIVRLGFAGAGEVARALARQLHLEFLEVEVVDPDDAAVAAIPASLAERHRILPLRFDPDGALAVATSDPTNVVALDDAALAAGARIRVVVASPGTIEDGLRRAYGLDTRAGALIDAIDADSTAEADTSADDLLRSAADAPVVRLAESIVVDAVGARASDVHVEPGSAETVVRYRVDGVLREVMRVPRSAAGPLVSRLKLMAAMDIAERRRPQDGRARFRTPATDGRPATDVDLRVSTLPSMHGETVVIRLLRKGAERLGLSDVGLSSEQLAAVSSVLDRPQGLILLTGPTGSGKTSTLYSFLGHLAGEANNTITIEDPVEYELPGVNQTQTNERIGLTFAKALRTVLRQDPDIVMLGEIRDPETAELALQASLTGHLVLSTLHTNDAAGAVVRLRDLGIPPYLIASSLSMIIAQRLARTVCQRCSTPAEPTERQVRALHLAPRDIAAADLRTGAGCATCGHSGYRGRVGLFEILTVDAAVRELVAASASEAAIRSAARLGGMRSLREDGLAKAAAGRTTLDELLRVTPVDSGGEGHCPVCSQTVQEDFALCPWCGTDLRPDACSGCHRRLERGWTVCPTCGTPALRPDAAERLPRVLVVDDDPSVRAAVKAMLTGDFDTVEAPDGRTALEVVGTARPDLVLLDVGMPELDGYAVTRALRARPVTMHLPVVLMTGDDDKATELAGLRAGADDYLTKPLDLDVLVARLSAVLRRVAT